MPTVTFNDYVDERGANVVKEWLWGLPEAARSKINVRIGYLERTEQAAWGHYTGKLAGGQWDDVYEIRVKTTIQYRPLFCYGPNKSEATILLGAVEKGSQLPPNAPQITRERKSRLFASRSNHATPHDISGPPPPGNPKPAKQRLP